MHIAISLLHNSIVNAMHTAFVSIKTKKKKVANKTFTCIHACFS